MLSLIEHLGNQLIAKEKKDEVLSNAIRKIYEGISNSNASESIEDIQEQKEKLNKRKDDLMDLLLDGIISKADYSSKVNEISNQLAALSEKEIRVQEKKEENNELFARLNQVRALFEDKTEKGIEVPLMCSHIEQIKVYEKRLDIYLDFINDTSVINVNFGKSKRKNILDMPIGVGRILPG